MRTIYLILCFILFLGCSEGVQQQRNSIIENAALYYYPDPEFGGSQCTFVIEPENNEVFTPNTEFYLSTYNIPDNDSNPIINNLKITYRLTDDKIDRCHHKGEFLEEPINVIEIISVEKN